MRLWEFSQKQWEVYRFPKNKFGVRALLLFALISVFALLFIQVHILVFTLRLLYTTLTL